MNWEYIKKVSIGFVMLGVFSFQGCSSDEIPQPQEEVVEENNNTSGQPEGDFTIWTGSLLSFSKIENADPDNSENQDRITDNVWITRGNNGGQIYNAKSEGQSNKSRSPIGTRWAKGTIDDLTSDNILSFSTFREAVGSPKDVVGQNLVLHLVDDNIYLSVRFTSWSEGKGGGFSYQRSTEQ